ncbi:MAG: class I SAM-dependent methyltransferase, partial [Usitatibacter sp.]
MFWDKPLDNALSSLKKNVSAPVRLVLWDGREVTFSDKPLVTLRVKGMRAATALMRPSLLSLAEAYIDGHADLEGDLGEAIRGAEAFTRATPRPLFQSRGPTNERHTKSADREAIQHHYDVSNEFYALWLDPRMVYSCAYFHSDDDTLEAAQLQKLDHICTKLRLAPGESFLDIGCGWGALVIRAAERYGVKATGITLSENQYRLANELIRAAGLQDRCKVILQDYRDAPGEGVYDKIASVGMFEHVGLRNLSLYFGTVRRLLKEKGLFLNHGITTSDTRNRSVGLG